MYTKTHVYKTLSIIKIQRKLELNAKALIQISQRLYISFPMIAVYYSQFTSKSVRTDAGSKTIETESAK